MELEKLLKMLQPKTSYAIDSNYWKGTTIQQFYKKHRRQLVLVTPKSTSTQFKSTKGTSVVKVGQLYKGQNGAVYDPKGLSPTLRAGVTNNPKHGGIGSCNSPKIIVKDTKTMETAQKLNGMMFQILTCYAVDFLVKPLALLANEVGFTIHEARSFLKSLGVLGKNNHAFFCLKTSKGFYLTTKETRSLQSLPRWMSLGMTYNGKCLTLRTSAFHKTENECSLSDILEEHVDQKYFLSEKMTKYLQERINQTKDGHKPNIVQHSEGGI